MMIQSSEQEAPQLQSLRRFYVYRVPVKIILKEGAIKFYQKISCCLLFWLSYSQYSIYNMTADRQYALPIQMLYGYPSDQG